MPQTRKYLSGKDRQAAYRARLAAARRQELTDRGLPPLPPLAVMPGRARWNAAVRRSLQLLAMVRDEMEDYYEERSEAWQQSERGGAHEDRMDGLDALITDLEAFAEECSS